MVSPEGVPEGDFGLDFLTIRPEGSSRRKDGERVHKAHGRHEGVSSAHTGEGEGRGGDHQHVHVWRLQSECVVKATKPKPEARVSQSACSMQRNLTARLG